MQIRENLSLIEYPLFESTALTTIVEELLPACRRTKQWPLACISHTPAQVGNALKSPALSVNVTMLELAVQEKIQEGVPDELTTEHELAPVTLITARSIRSELPVDNTEYEPVGALNSTQLFEDP